MPVNRSKGNMYEGVDTWNPFRGCRYDCIYCYVKSIPGYDTTPQFVEKNLDDHLGSGRTIFVSSTGDIGGDWVEPEWVDRILKHCKRYANRYLFQSKNLGAFENWLPFLPPSTILATTIETNRDLSHISKAPHPSLRAMAMARLSQGRMGIETMITIEPIMEFDDLLIDWIRYIRPTKVAIGLDSKKSNLPEPSKERVLYLIESIKDITEVKLKSNLNRLGIDILGPVEKQMSLF